MVMPAKFSVLFALYFSYDAQILNEIINIKKEDTKKRN